MTKFRKLIVYVQNNGLTIGIAQEDRDHYNQEIERVDKQERVLRTHIRVGDAAPMAYIEFIDRENELRQSKPATPQPPQLAPLDPWTRPQLSRCYAPPKEEKNSDSDI